METVTHEEAVVPSKYLTPFADADELAEAADIDADEAESLLWLIEERQSNRAEDRFDIVVTFEEWAYEDWADYDIADGPVMVVGHIKDYREKSYMVRGAFDVVWDKIENRPPSEVQSEYVTELLQQVDNTDTDYVERIGKAYLPKSAVDSLLVYE